MNILPKKRWHVRTKDNIARVRRDEAAAREIEKQKEEKLKLAESEARLNFLRRQSGVPEKFQEPQASQESEKDSNVEQKHVDLFADYKTHVKSKNKELEKEQKEEKEKYEKQIGYLTYLGQDTNEALKLKSWYEVAPKQRDFVGNNTVRKEKDVKRKYDEDPLTLIKALLPKKVESKSTDSKNSMPAKEPISAIEKLTNSSNNVDYLYEKPSVASERAASEKSKTFEKDLKAKKPKKRKNSIEKVHKSSKKLKKEKKSKKSKKYKKHKGKDSDDSDSNSEEITKRLHLELLRKERLKREAEERQRAEALLSSLNPSRTSENKETQAPIQRMVQRYNSQFNPDLAKQNML